MMKGAQLRTFFIGSFKKALAKRGTVLSMCNPYI